LSLARAYAALATRSPKAPLVLLAHASLRLSSPEARDRARLRLLRLPGGLRAYHAAVQRDATPVRGPLDHPASPAHVADLRREIARLTAEGRPKQAQAIRAALARHGIEEGA
jgi:hypothetical protein